MAEYSYYKIKDYKFSYYRNYLNPSVPYLFSYNDLVIEGESKYFRTTIRNVKTALQISGYSNNYVKESYEKYILYEKYYEVSDSYEDEKTIKKHILNKYPFEDWKNGVKKYFELMIEKYNDDLDYDELNDVIKIAFDELPPSNLVEEEITRSIASYETQGYYGLDYNNPYFDELLILSIVVDILDPEEILEYDLTPPFEWSLSIEDVKEAFTNVNKILIIVEGKSDKEIILNAFNNLYPQFEHLYNIISFDGSIPGGSSFVRHYFNLLSNAKVDNKVIALFDNDTAGLEEISILKEHNYDNKYKYITLPNNSFFESYPSIFPDGEIVNSNINGKACSVELYLPKEFISRDGNLEPIIWTSYRNKLKQHQGVIRNKGEIKLRGFDKSLDWSRFSSIFETIFAVWD